MSLLLAAALLLGAPARAAERAPIAVPGPLQALGVQLAAAVPGLSPANLYVPGFAPLAPAEAARLRLPSSAAPYPAAVEPAKAAVLLERAQALSPAARPSGGETAAAPGSARALLESVNSVLADFTPRQLRDLPAEDLDALAGAILDQSGPAAGGGAAAAVLSRQRARLIEERRAAQPRMDQPYPNVLDGHEMPRYTRDVPDSARFLQKPYPVFRHYLSPERKAKAVEAGALTNAVLPYVRRTHGVWHDYYETLTGIFLTLPGVPGSQVGVREENASWLDVAVSEAFPILELEPGRIYLLPLPGMTEAWVADAYRRWISGDAGALSYHGQLPRLEENGGPGPRLQAPVTIVGASR